MAAYARPVARVGSSRRKPPILPIALLGLAVGAIAIATMFVWPELHTRKTSFDLGSTDDYRIGSVTTIGAGRFYLVRPSEDEFTALSWRDPSYPHCTVPWRPTFLWKSGTGPATPGWFRNPCSGSTYDREGHRVFGPAERDLDRYSVAIFQRRLVVDTSRYVCGYAPPGEACVASGP